MTHALKVCALATGLADKAVSLIYERVLHPITSEVWVARCRAQIADVLAVLESDRAAKSSSRFWFGDAIGHADIAVACALARSRARGTDGPCGDMRRARSISGDSKTVPAASMVPNVEAILPGPAFPRRG